ncbi:hypothetical protein JK364_37540 [Streptomyces sp. 110]|uniref:Uncharacterized protein n=1 Tax=Streptomyces endocoffeicus TaxID=2898945 RepID=A0ABS1Q031_9ACTN|nr:hypothetical protein [Streptomyces endocoffeicus]MBL1118041.1 hypothetical protein [Streptomyces endocoffeicus]
MARDDRKARRLVVGGDTFLWSLRHTHRTLDDGRHTECCETLVLRLFRARVNCASRSGAAPAGRCPDDPTRRELDGWALFASVGNRRVTR